MHNKRDKMNILISINSKFVIPAIVMLTSLFENNKVPIDVYMLYSSLSKNEIEKVDSYVKKYNNNLFPIKIDNSLFNIVPINAYISREAYYRIISYTLLPPNLSRILYLDSDIIVNGSLIHFYTQNFDNKHLIACEAKTISKKNLRIYKNLNMPKDIGYFNSGVLLYNLVLWRKNINSNFILKYINDNRSKLKWHDQDVLNALFYDKVKFDNYKIYNLDPWYDKYKKEEIRFDYNNSVIIHFAGPIKPWNKNCDNIPFADLFWKYANKTEYRYKNLTLQIKDIFYKYLNLL